MGLFTHLFAFSAGVAVGVRMMLPETDDENTHYVKINRHGVKIVDKDILTITRDTVDIAGIFQFNRRE